MRENHYVKALFSSREGHFSLRWIEDTRYKAKGLRITSEGYIGELGVRCLSTLNRDGILGNSFILLSHIVLEYTLIQRRI